MPTAVECDFLGFHNGVSGHIYDVWLPKLRPSLGGNRTQIPYGEVIVARDVRFFEKLSTLG